jgi:uncharacterized protein YecA (UPF0149 family)
MNCWTRCWSTVERKSLFTTYVDFDRNDLRPIRVVEREVHHETARTIVSTWLLRSRVNASKAIRPNPESNAAAASSTGKELTEKLGRNDPCPCGSARRFKTVLLAQRPL